MVKKIEPLPIAKECNNLARFILSNKLILKQIKQLIDKSNIIFAKTLSDRNLFGRISKMVINYLDNSKVRVLK